MEEERMEQQPEVAAEAQQEKPRYIPRPMWQVWAARVALVLFLFVLLMYYLNMFRGGL